MMEDDYLAPEINELREAVQAQNEGLKAMLGIQEQHGAMLREILTACAAPETEGPSPLVKLLLALNEAIEGQAAALGRIEAAVSRKSGW